MTKLMRRSLPLVAVLAFGAIVVASAFARGSAPARSTAKIQICALLPDTTSSVRYQLFDKPYLAKAFRKAKVTFSILNALGDPQKQRSQADQCMTNGAKVILLDALNSGVGVAIETTAAAKGVKTIDYDRLVLGGKASYYVSFDNVVVGKTMANGLVQAIRAKGLYGKKPVISELNGGITDNNATLFKKGYDAVLNPLYRKGTFKKAQGGDQWTDWDAQKALTIFEQILVRNGNKVNASIAANDNLAGAVITALKNHDLKPIPLTGQDATPQGLQNILAGWQSGTVFKRVKVEAASAAAAAIAVLRGKKVKTNGRINNKVKNVPSFFLTPLWVTKKNYKILFKEGYLKRGQVCIGVYKKYCK